MRKISTEVNPVEQLKRVVLNLVVLSFLLLSSSLVYSEEQSTELKDLRYGAALYRYYQDDFLTALTEMAVAKKRGGLIGHAEHAELLVGGMSLSYGLDRRAIEIFDQLLKENIDSNIRDQAWFYLAKLLYQRQANDKAKFYIQQVGDQLPEHLRDEYHYLHVLLNADDLSAVNRSLENIEGKAWRSYSLFNRAMVERQQGNIDSAIASLILSSALLPDNEEERALLDRIYLSLGYIGLSQKRYNLAYDSFKKVRLEGPWAEQALLGYGWSAVNSQDYSLALQAWNTLSQKPVIGPVVQETFVAIPHLYEKMGENKKALKDFESAAAHYEELLLELESMILQVNSQDMIERWLQNDLHENWLARQAELDVNPQSAYLFHMLAQYQFQTSLKDLRDLQVLHNNLLTWQRNVVTYRDMLATRQYAREERIKNIKEQPLDTLLTNITPLRDELASTVERAEQEQSPLLLANADQRELKQIIDNASKLADSITDANERGQYKLRLQRIGGGLIWQLSEEFPRTLWQAKSELNRLDDALLDHKNRLEKLKILMAESNEQVSLSTQVDEQQVRIDGQIKAVEAAIDIANQEMRLLVVTELNKQKQNVRLYLTQSRLAIARIYDEYLQQGERN